MPRIKYIDIAKAICIILVVIGHYCPESAPEYWKQFVNFIYTFHMPLFMFASGYVYNAYTNKKGTYLEFVSKKVRRLLIPYFCVSILVITIKIIAGYYMNIDNPCDVSSYIEMLYMPVAGFFLWFLYVLFLIFLIIPLFKTKLSRSILWGVSLLLYLLPYDFPHEFCLYEFQNIFFFFMCGVGVVDYSLDFHSPTGNGRLYLAFLLLSVNLIAVLLDWTDIRIVTLGLALNGIVCILWISSYIERYRPNAFSTIINSSFIIYLLHTVFEGFTKVLLQYTVPASFNIFIVSAMIIITGGVLLPIITDKYVIRRYGITKYMFGIK